MNRDLQVEAREKLLARIQFMEMNSLECVLNLFKSEWQKHTTTKNEIKH